MERLNLLISPVDKLRLEGLKIATKQLINQKRRYENENLTFNIKIDRVSSSTLLIIVNPLSPCKPFKKVDTLTLMPSRVIWPILMFATARDWPTNRNSAMEELVNFWSRHPKFELNGVFRKGKWAAYWNLKMRHAENQRNWVLHLRWKCW